MPGDLQQRLRWATDVTLADLQALIDNEVSEGSRLDYKRELGDGRRVVRTIAAMANTFGGVLIVGMDESSAEEDRGFDIPGANGLVGVDPGAKEKLAGWCSNRLEPPFDPEIVSVRLPNDRAILVVRIDEDLAPRPVVFEHAVPVRTDHGNRAADIHRMRSLFAESTAGRWETPTIMAQPWPQIHSAFHDADSPADLVIRGVGGARLASGRGRPFLNEAARRSVQIALRSSMLNQWLSTFHSKIIQAGGVNAWTPRGQNSSNRMELRWEGLLPSSTLILPEGRVVIEWARPSLSDLSPRSVSITTDFVLRLATTAPNGAIYQRLPLETLFYALLAILETFADTFPGVLESVISVPVGRIEGPAAGVATRQGTPINKLFFTTQFGLIASGGAGQGGELLPVPGSSLGDRVSREGQARLWLEEFLIDNGFDHGVDAAVRSIAG